MQPRQILLVVTGGIAAYKVPELVRLLRGEGHPVRCVLSAAAGRFVSPLVLQTLSGQSVRTDLFDVGEENEIDHIRLADWAELVLVAPATANVLARMAHGIADDLVSAVLLATRAPVLVAPAMNVHMWQHPATRANLATLRERGVQVVGPEQGELACGWTGPGRMSEPARIAAVAERMLTPASLAGERVLVTAGGTAEPLDAVRRITNRSSGKMGFAIAAEAARRAADVCLVAGLTALETPESVRRIDVETALEMREVVFEEWPASSIVVKAAAVADFRPADPLPGKLKKEKLAGRDPLTLELVLNPDILHELCQRKQGRFVVGFAAESEDVVEAARRKLVRKGCDLIVANDISRRDAGFDADSNAVHLVTPDGDVESIPLQSKREVAARLLDRIEKLRRGQA